MSTGSSLRQTFALANDFKEGDLAVGGTTDDRLRAEAREALLGTTLHEIRRSTFVDDDVTEALERGRDRHRDTELDPLTVADVKRVLLSTDGLHWVQRYRDALGSELIAAVAKVMTNDELSSLARRLFNPHDERGTALGAAQHFGSRIQPNSPGDDEEEVLFSVLEGLTYGCGDVIIGLNPAADELDTIVRLEQLLEQVVTRLKLPTRYCVLSDIVKQHRARTHVEVDVAFQSLAGTSRALRGMVGLDIDGIAALAKEFDALYFETGQGSAVTNGAAEGVDMVTLEARAYGVAREIVRQVAATRPDGSPPWLIVNDVAGFIGPEVFRTPEQLERACLEDLMMAKMHGLAMGLDVCATFHMGISPAALRTLTGRIVERGAPAYLMAVAGNADPMLGYLTTSFAEHPGLRQRTGRQMRSAMAQRLAALDMLDGDGTARPGVDRVASLYAKYVKAGGDQRTDISLEEEGRRRVATLRDRGFDLGLNDAAASEQRIERLYGHARSALYAHLDEHVITEATTAPARVRTLASSRDEYLARPSTGESLAPADARQLQTLYTSPRPQVQIVISDGLNANSVNEQLRTILPAVGRLLQDRGVQVGGHHIVVQHGRVRVGYEIGQHVVADVIVHLIGERPGTGLNTLSAYLTYGRDEGGRLRWTRDLDHSVTNAICGIHPRGKPPGSAAVEIARTVARMLEQRRSGVRLDPGPAGSRSGP